MGRKIQMMASISGYRPDGLPWPPIGSPLVVEDWEAEHLFRGEMARPWPGGEPQETPAAQEPAEPAVAQASVPQVEAPQAETVRGRAPKPVEPKAEWVAWAVSQGAHPEEAAASTKAELMEQYGDRA